MNLVVNGPPMLAPAAHRLMALRLAGIVSEKCRIVRFPAIYVPGSTLNSLPLKLKERTLSRAPLLVEFDRSGLTKLGRPYR